MHKSRMFVLLVASLLSTQINAEIYKWVDAQGKIHYGDKINTRPNKSNKKEAESLDIDISIQGNITISPKRSEKRQKLLDTFDDDRQRKNKIKDKKRKQNQKKARACVIYKDRMRRYLRASSLYTLDNGGNRITMSDAQREHKTMVLRKKIDTYCK